MMKNKRFRKSADVVMVPILVASAIIFCAGHANALGENRIIDGKSGRCLDADLGTINQNGTKVQLWDCWGSWNQYWRFSDTDGTITNVQSGKCLDADLSTINQNGTTVQLFDCWGGQNQQWRINDDDTITNVQSGKCLDADLGTINQNGTKVQLWDCWGGQNQQWFLEPFLH